MKLINELLDYHKDIKPKNCVLFTANSVVKANGELVVGAGNALAAAVAVTGLAKKFGYLVTAEPDRRIHTALLQDGIIASFQTKLHWKNDSPLWLVEESVLALKALALDHDTWTFHLPMPAVGRGGLSKELVLPLLEQLPNNVLVYHK